MAIHHPRSCGSTQKVCGDDATSAPSLPLPYLAPWTSFTFARVPASLVGWVSLCKAQWLPTGGNGKLWRPTGCRGMDEVGAVHGLRGPQGNPWHQDSPSWLGQSTEKTLLLFSHRQWEPSAVPPRPPHRPHPDSAQQLTAHPTCAGGGHRLLLVPGQQWGWYRHQQVHVPDGEEYVSQAVRTSAGSFAAGGKWGAGQIPGSASVEPFWLLQEYLLAERRRRCDEQCSQSP